MYLLRTCYQWSQVQRRLEQSRHALGCASLQIGASGGSQHAVDQCRLLNDQIMVILVGALPRDLVYECMD